MKEIYLTDEGGLSAQQAEALIDQMLAQYPDLQKVLIVPPDLTRCYSYAGELTKLLWKKLTPQVKVDIIPALGTHMALTREEEISFFGAEIPESAFLVHHWQTDTVKLGSVPAAFCAEASGGMFAEDIDVEVNRTLIEGNYDLILSVGQVVPHEVVGMANYSKNIFVGLGGRSMINKVHMMSAICGIENTLGVIDTPARRVYDYAQQHFLDGKYPIVYLLTVVTQDEDERLHLLGLFAGDSRKPFEQAAALAQKHNIVHVERRAKKVVAYLDPGELRTTWVGNKGIYRTRMLVADDGELLLLAPGVAAFGENDEIDALIREYGYCGREKVLQYYGEGAFENRTMGAAHLIQGSSDGRFTTTYATKPELLSREDIESVHFQWMDYDEAVARYNPEQLKDGWNIMPDGEEIYFVRTPALGLWVADGEAAQK